MIIIRSLLRKIRELNSKDGKYDFKVVLLVIITSATILGMIVDKYIPYSPLFNSFRGAIAIINGASIFAISYILSIGNMMSKSMDDPGYLTIRKRFTYRQRVNIAIVGGVILFGMVILGAKPGLFYTLIASLVITGALTLMAFVRTYRSEYMKAINSIPDSRDLAFEKDRKLRKEQAEAAKEFDMVESDIE